MPNNEKQVQLAGSESSQVSTRTLTAPRRQRLPKTVGPSMVNRVVAWVEAFWFEFKRYPNDTEFLQQFDIDAPTLEKLHSYKRYRNAVRSRGIILPGVPLTPDQLGVVALVTNFADTRSLEAKLMMCGVSLETYHGWMQDPEFKRMIQSRADESLGNIYPEAVNALSREVKSGNMNAIKFYWDITGRSQTPEVRNLQIIIQLLIESVQRNVKDPEILSAISLDFDRIISTRAAE